MKIKILGNGVWGKALYLVISQNFSDVSILKREEKSADHDVLVLALPTESIREAFRFLSFPENKIIINTTKGIERATHFLPSQIVASVLGGDVDYYSLIGPSFAREVCEGIPTLVNLGYVKEGPNNQTIKNLFETRFFRIRLTKGVEALEISAAFKNIYAIACGISEGLGYKENTKLQILSLAIEEIKILWDSLGLISDKDATAGTLGDLILTCMGGQSRNFIFGKLIASCFVQDARLQINGTIEGLNSLLSVPYFKEKSKTPLPLASLVERIVVINDPKTVKGYFDKFLREDY